MSTSSGVSHKLLYGISMGLGVTMISAASYWYYKYYKKDIMPTRWRRVGTLAKVNFFPVKSCAPLKLSDDAEVLCEVLGLRLNSVRDRALMLVNEDNKMVTARAYPKMVTIKTQMIGPTIIMLTANGMESLEIDFATLIDEAPGKDIHTAVWGTEVDAMLCGEKYDKWFSKVILNKESGLHLVYFPYPKPVRVIRTKMHAEKNMTNEDTGTFGDATSYMILNLASLKDLNTRLPRPVDALQFRGNFHLNMDNDEPYAEDHWGWVKIGDNAIFRVVAPCTRCIFTNINVDTGERDPDGEPLKTLKKYRTFKGYESPTLGLHLGLRQAGSVKVNDVIYVEEK